MKKIIGMLLAVLMMASVAGQEKSESEEIIEKENLKDDLKNQQVPLDWYTSLNQIRARTKDDVPASVTVTVVLGYKKGDKKTSKEIEGRRIEITDFLRRFFSRCSVEDLGPQNEQQIRKKLCDQLNKNIFSEPMILDVRVTSLDVFRQ